MFDGNDKNIRVSGSNYKSGNVSITRLFRVRSDYKNADLTNDAVSLSGEPISEITTSMIDNLYAQYEKDWNEWPVENGAPFLDVNENNIYEADIDIPGVPGAIQTLFVNYSDEKAEELYESPQIGLDIRETYWGYNYNGALEKVIYKKVEIIYSGNENTPSESYIDSLYICQFVDTDLGDYQDDLSGCDTSLNMGYTYNATNNDEIFSQYYSAAPAVGYVFLNGASEKSDNISDTAIVNFKRKSGYKYFNSKPMTSFIYDASGNTWGEPGLDYSGAKEFYNIMRGKLPIPHYPAAQSFSNNLGISDDTFTYLLPGDPVAGDGIIDGTLDIAGNRSLYMSSGPISMEVGDTIEVVLMIVGGMGSDNIDSITKLRANAKGGIQFYKDYLVDEIALGTITDINQEDNIYESIPKDYALLQNYPNPFNPSTQINFQTAENGFVNLTVYNILGQEVENLISKVMAAGNHSIIFDASKLSGGIYFYNLKVNNFNNVKKMLLIK